MTHALTLTSTLPLPKANIPCLGLGVFRTGSGQPTIDAVRWALECGYRHIDTAHIYRNEEEVGEALKHGSVPREQVFITTKLWNDDHGYDNALRAFDESARALGVEVIDLYLIHWPVAEKRLASWRALERLYEQGRARAIGVSNYMLPHLQELFANCQVQPMVNQIELHPFCQQRKVVDWCREHGIVVEAYSPVTKGRRLDDPTLVKLATALDRSPAQVLIRWGLQKGFVVIPKSANQKRIGENAKVFDFSLTAEQVSALDALDEQDHLAWDPRQQP